MPKKYKKCHKIQRNIPNKNSKKIGEKKILNEMRFFATKLSWKCFVETSPSNGKYVPTIESGFWSLMLKKGRRWFTKSGIFSSKRWKSSRSSQLFQVPTNWHFWLMTQKTNIIISYNFSIISDEKGKKRNSW